MSAPIHAKGWRQCSPMEQMISTTIAVTRMAVNAYVRLVQMEMELVQHPITQAIACTD